MSSVRTALYTALAGATSLTDLLADPPAEGPHEHAIYWRRAPKNAQSPFVIYSKQAGTPMHFMAGQPVNHELWLVRGVSRDDAAAAEDIAEQIDAVLNRAQLSLETGELLSCLRGSDRDYGETADDTEWHHVGAEYRLEVDQDG